MLFGHISGVATPQSSGSNPDRSPVAQWLNMQISLASRLPAGCRPPGVQSKRSAGRPGVGGKPRRRGRLSEINTGAGKSPTVKTRAWELRRGAGGKHGRRGRLSEINTGAGNSAPVKTLVRPGVDNKPWRRGRFSKIKIWAQICSSQNSCQARR